MPDALKDQFFTDQFFDALTSALTSAYPDFDESSLRAAIYTPDWGERALMDKMRHTTRVLHDHLPADYRAALAVIRQIIPALRSFGFEKLVYSEFVAMYGLDDWDASLPALETFTQEMSAEFAVRPFIVHDQARMMAQMRAWAEHDSEHVRRLASEGCRPRLPWGIALQALKTDPAPILPILDMLKNDPSESVRRSVANNLNDIAKDNPAIVTDTLTHWQPDATPEIEWITQHALRTLVKKGDPAALKLLGYGVPQVVVRNLTLEQDQVALGDTVGFSFEVESTGTAEQALVIDYIAHLMRARGQQTPKVFKLTKKTLAPGEVITLTGQQSFKPITTRKYYPGAHAIEIQINGHQYARADFEVIE